jgi:hypothetical protein
MCSDSGTPQTLVFALRLRRERPGAPWRAALRGADWAAPIGFADLEQLAVFLLRLANSQALPGDPKLEGRIDDGS